MKDSEYEKKYKELLQAVSDTMPDSIDCEKKIVEDGYVWILLDDKDEAYLKRLEIKITSKWVGYSLCIKEVDTNRVFEIEEDTDNYDLGFDLAVTNEIFKDTLIVLKAFMNHQVDVKKDEKRIIVSFSTGIDEKQVHEFEVKKRFFKEFVISKKYNV